MAVSAETIWERHGEKIAALALLTIATFYLCVSWRKWPDPQIDFGRELYLPWRLSQGAVLYRDLDGHYGPLSQYFNATLFRVFGASLMTLVVANICIFAAIATLLYLLCRRAWGRLGAFVATAFFIAVFGFSHLVFISNYTYAAPYAHEVTHGMLLTLALIFVLRRWLDNPSARWSFSAGFLLGLTSVLKPEFILAGVAATGTAGVLRWHAHGWSGFRALGWFVLGVALPTVLFALFFLQWFSPLKALEASCQAWINFITPHARAVGIQSGFSGLDRPANHLAEHALAILIALGSIAAIAAAGWFAERMKRWPALGFISGAIIAGLAWISCTAIDWMEAGRCLLGLLFCYLIASVVFLRRRAPGDATRLLLAVVAAALMARMFLSGRIYQYGFYQAALAGSIVPAILLAELPGWLRMQASGRLAMSLASAALLVPGIARVTAQSQDLFRLQTAPIGQGGDRFYGFPARIDATAEMINALTNHLQQAATPNETLLVVPEGIMLNYLTRMRSPVPGYFFLHTDPALIDSLESNPPDWVVVISRDLREYGVARYGENAGAGREILDWLAAHYRRVAHVGSEPLDYRKRGAVIFRRNEAR